MSEDEIKQTYMIESIFKKFDKDGTGSLDTNEL
jgi:Ca2+-binding EF-hand superfamily protein